MKRIILFTTVLVFSLPSYALESSSTFDAFNENDPVIEHLRLAMENVDELQYSLKRCAGLLLAGGTAMHKLSKEENAQEMVDLGEQLMEFLAKFQITNIQQKELTQDNFNVVYGKNAGEVMAFNRKYYLRFERNFKNTGQLIEQDPFLADESLYCVGIHNQIFGDN